MTSPVNIVAIGASAGGLNALKKLLENLPSIENTGIVVAQHLSPDHSSKLTAILQRSTKVYKVLEAQQGVSLEQNHIYVTPPNSNIEIAQGKLVLSAPSSQIIPKPSIDKLFYSLAAEKVRKKVAILLSGTGSDGAQGSIALKEAGASIIIQDTDEAQHAGLPLATMQTGAVDAELPAKEMGAYVYNLLKQTHDAEQAALDKIIDKLDLLRDSNFKKHKQPSVLRRLRKRMAELNLKNLDEYAQLLENKPQEAKKLNETLLIGVTSFFRDKEAFEIMNAELEKLLAKKGEDEPIRIWVPGCSTGEEAYSIAIMVCEIDRNQRTLKRLQIFGSDIDERAIATARQGIYSFESLKGMNENLLKRYFEKQETGYQVTKELRSKILFSRHDLVNNAPYLKQDLISCRNLLIYFDQKLQRQVIPVFHYALNKGGLLLLGKSESIDHFAKLFEPIDNRNKLYRRRRGGAFSVSNIPAISAQKPFNISRPETSNSSRPLSLQDRVKETLFASFEHPYVIVNEFFEVLETNGDLRNYLSFSTGATNLNVLNLITPQLQLELRAVLTQAIKNNHALSSKIKPLKLSDKETLIRFNIKPLTYQKDQENLFLIILEQLDFNENLILRTVNDSLEVNTDAYRELEWELASTKENLQNYIEEVETSNEELQALNEELLSLNEELQSTNEELETASEELQSSIEETQTAHTELQKTYTKLFEKDELLVENEARAHALLNNELQAFILLDKKKQILKYNSKAQSIFEELYGANLTLGMSLLDYLPKQEQEKFDQQFSNVLQGKTYLGEQKLKSVKNQQKWFRLNYSPVLYGKNKISAVSLGMLDITVLKQTLSKLTEAEQLVSTVFDSTEAGICVTDENGTFIDVNNGFCKLYGYSKEDLLGKNFTTVVPPNQRDAMQKLHDSFIDGKEELPFEAEVVDKKGNHWWVSSSAQRLVREDGSVYKVTSVQNITERKALEAQKNALRDGLPGVTWQFRVFPSGKEALYSVSEGSLPMWGLSPEEAMEDINKLWAVINPEDLERIKAETLLAGEKMASLNVEFRVQKSQEQETWHRMSAKPQKLSDGSLLWNCLALDITIKKNTQLSLKESKLKLSLAVEIASLGYWEIDGSLEPHVLKWSEEHYKIWEQKPEEFDHTITGFLKTVHPDDLAEFTAVYNQMTLDKEPFDLNYRINVKGKTKWIHAKGVPDTENPNFYRGTAQEITAQKEEEERLKLLESVVTHSGDPVMITKAWPQQGKGPEIIYVNEAFTEMTGYSYDEAIGNTPRILQGPKSNKEDLKKMGQAMLKWQPSEVTTINYKKNGEEFWNNFKIHPVENEKGEYTHWVSIDRDVTAFKTRERQQELLKHISFLFDELEKLQDVLEAVVKKLVIDESFDVAEIWLLDHRAEHMDLRAFHHAKSDFKAFHGTANEHSLKKGEGLAGNVWQTKKELFVRNLSDDKLYVRKKAAKKAGINTAYAIPLLHAKEIVGVLLLGSVADFTETQNFQLLLESFTTVLGTEIQRKKLEEDVKNIYNTAPDVISVSDFEGNILEINKAGAELFGYSSKELLTMNWLQLMHPEDHEQTLAEREKYQKGNSTKYTENRYHTKSGQLIWLAWTVKPDVDQGITFGVAKNVTQEKELQILLDNANRIARLGAWKIDLPKNEVFWSKMASLINEAPEGYSPGNIKNKLSLYPEGAHRERVQLALNQAIEKHHTFDIEVIKFTYGKKKKKWVRLIGEPVIQNGKCVMINGTIQDIDKSKRAELLAFKTLEEKEEILESIGDGFYSVDSNYKITYWNQKSAELLQTPKNVILGNSLWKLFPEAKNSELYNRYEEAIQKGKEQHFTYYYAPLNVYYDISVFPAKGKSLSVYFKDITERFEYVRAIEEKNKRLSQIAWTQSHVVRAPLARIMGLVQLMEDGLIEEKEQKQILDTIMESSYELDNVIREIVQLSQTK